MKELIGKTITNIYVNQDQSLLMFEVENERLVYEAKGDCCSETWFADVIGVRNLPLTVTEVEDVEMPAWLQDIIVKDGRCRQEEDVVYGYTIKGKGKEYWIKEIGICYRNSSNGYYGGSCSLLTGSKYSTELLQKAVWTEISEDWQA